VHDVVSMGRAMDGSVFEITLDGFCALIIGAMGAGKSLGALRTINEALTACRDAVVWDLDPIKGGLDEFGDLMARRARTPEECEEALEEALSYVSARRHLIASLGMGDRWHATETHPNLYINIDEFIQLSPKGKELAVKILRTGRQYGIYLIMAGQEATADALGDAIALIIAYRILMACRFEDIKIAFGTGAGAQGWRPDRMKPAVGPVANDAGQAMIMGGPFNRAIRYQFNKYDQDQIVAAVPQRIQAGVTRMDADTVLTAGAKLSAAGQRENLTARLAGSDHPDAALLAALLGAFDEKRREFLPTNEVLLPALTAAGVDGVDATALSNRLRKHAPGAKSDRTDCPEGSYLRGWRRDAVEKAAAGLLDPAKARRDPGTRAA
jgi:S-DNA-T family DNA segregation ATPase FtsK/SpoIIIE